MSTSKKMGDRGERVTAQYLERCGCTILARQWKCRYGEIDLVSRTPDGVLCFVEVKLRNCRAIAPPCAFVDVRKQERLRKAALCYLAIHEEDAPTRFDVAEVTSGGAPGYSLHYIPNAFC